MSPQNFIRKESPQVLDDLDFRLRDRQAPDVDVTVKPKADGAVMTDQSLPRDWPAGKHLQYLNQDEIRRFDDVFRSIDHRAFMRRWIIRDRRLGVGLEVVGLEHLVNLRLQCDFLGLALHRRRLRHGFALSFGCGGGSDLAGSWGPAGIEPAREEDDENNARCGGKFSGPVTAHESRPSNAVQNRSIGERSDDSRSSLLVLQQNSSLHATTSVLGRLDAGDRRY